MHETLVVRYLLNETQPQIWKMFLITCIDIPRKYLRCLQVNNIVSLIISVEAEVGSIDHNQPQPDGRMVGRSVGYCSWSRGRREAVFNHSCREAGPTDRDMTPLPARALLSG